MMIEEDGFSECLDPPQAGRVTRAVGIGNGSWDADIRIVGLLVAFVEWNQGYLIFDRE
jgi:hypothetical protein